MMMTLRMMMTIMLMMMSLMIGPSAAQQHLAIEVRRTLLFRLRSQHRRRRGHLSNPGNEIERNRSIVSLFTTKTDFRCDKIELNFSRFCLFLKKLDKSRTLFLLFSSFQCS